MVKSRCVTQREELESPRTTVGSQSRGALKSVAGVFRKTERGSSSVTLPLPLPLHIIHRLSTAGELKPSIIIYLGSASIEELQTYGYRYRYHDTVRENEENDATRLRAKTIR
jgi:hypothetical protein